MFVENMLIFIFNINALCRTWGARCHISSKKGSNCVYEWWKKSIFVHPKLLLRRHKFAVLQRVHLENLSLWPVALWIAVK